MTKMCPNGAIYWRCAFAALASLSTLTSCGGSGDGTPSLPMSTHSVGGTVTGLSGTGLVLRNNGGNDQTIAANGSFVFSTLVAAGANYSVSVVTQPSNPSQTCVPSGGAGVVGSANVTSVIVNCTSDAFAVGGSVSGLVGTGLVLQNNYGDDLNVGASGIITFSTPMQSGTLYGVSVRTQPTTPRQVCTVVSGSGTVAAVAVSDIVITCNSGIGRVALVANKDGSSVSSFTIDGGTGVLTQANGSPFSTVPKPRYGRAHPSGRFYFVFDADGGAIAAFTVDAATGVLSPVPGSPFSTSASTSTQPPPVVDLAGRILYVTIQAAPSPAMAQIYGFRIDSHTGSLTAIIGSPWPLPVANPVALVLDSRARFVYVFSGTTSSSGSAVATFSVATLTGALTQVGAPVPVGTALPVPVLPIEVVIDPTGRFIYTTGGNRAGTGIHIMTIDPQNGVPSGTGSTFVNGLAPRIDSLGRFLYLPRDVGTVSVFGIDGNSGSLTNLQTATSGALGQPGNLDLTPDGRFLYASNPNTVSGYSVDPATGLLSSLAGSPYAAGPPGSINTQVLTDQSGRNVFSIGIFTNSISSFAINESTGVLSPTSSLSTGQTPASLVVVGTQ
jgi:6-phosphogluconolactonase